MSTTPNLYVECRRCDECDHIGINDSHATDAACSSCAWSGPSPEQDKCPECGANGTMSTACPKCSGLYAFLADAHLPQAQQPAPAELLPAQTVRWHWRSDADGVWEIVGPCFGGLHEGQEATLVLEAEALLAIGEARAQAVRQTRASLKAQPAPAEPAVAQSLARLNAQIQWLRHGSLWDAAPMMAVTDMEVLRDAFAALDAAAAAPDGEAFELGRQQGISQERALWELARASQMAPAELAEYSDEWLRQRAEQAKALIDSLPPALRQSLLASALLPAAAAVQPPVVPLTELIEAASQWWCERTVNDWDEADLARAVIRHMGDWPGCPECDHECDEPCGPATVAEQLAAIDVRIAQLIHEGKLCAPEGYAPPQGWEPIKPPKRRVRGIGAVPLSKAQDVHQERRLDGGVRTEPDGDS